MEKIQIRPGFKEPWIKGLRSGEYTQTVGNLCDAKGFCCLGVLCVVAGQELDQHVSKEDQEDRYQWMKNEVFDPAKWGTSSVSVFYHMNDDARWSFSKIADWIEENVEECLG